METETGRKTKMLQRLRFSFSAAHFLPFYKGECNRPHGHTWHVTVWIRVNSLRKGMSRDFKRVVQGIKRLLPDHRDLNDILLNPTCESLAQHLFEILSEKYPVEKILLEEERGKGIEIFVQ